MNNNSLVSFVLFLSLFLFLFFFSSHMLYAHLAGQPSFFKINGMLTTLYPVQSVSVNTIAVPQDDAPQMYLVNQPIHFLLDNAILQIPQSVIANTKFLWDFGDGTKGTGLANIHTYTHEGSYIQLIYAKYSDLPAPQLIQSALVQILPTKNYQLPTVQIRINGKKSDDPKQLIIYFSQNTPLIFDASFSSGGSSRIVSYFWDFGDGTASHEEKVSHQYTSDYSLVSPFLRVTDANGFIRDISIQLYTRSPSWTAHEEKKKTNNGTLSFLVFLALFLLLAFGIIGMWKKKEKK